MFKLTSMRKIEFVFPKEYEHKITLTLGKDGHFEGINMQDISKWKDILLFDEHNDKIAQVDLFINKTSHLMKLVNGAFIPNKNIVETFEYSEQIIEYLQNDLADMERTYNDLEQEILLKTQYLNLFEKMLVSLTDYDEEDLIEIREFCIQNDCYFISQGIREEKKQAVQALFSSVDFMLPRPTVSNRGIPLIVFDKNSFYKVKNSETFLTYLLPEQPGGTFYQKRELITEIKQAEEKVMTEQEKLSQQLLCFCHESAKKINILYYKGYIVKRMLLQEAQYGRTETTVIISGWVPFYHVTQLVKKINEVTEGHVFFQSTIPSKKTHQLVPPTQFNNSFWIKPFERIITTYAVPSYSEIDPTSLVALSFVIMFGMMFGDLGQGILFVLIGIALYFNKKAQLKGIHDIGIILVSLGLSASFFGICYGSIFGVETWIEPILYSPMHHINQFLELAIIFGVVYISLGIGLNMINALEERDYKQLLISSNGLVGIWFYWGSLFVVIPFIKSGNTNHLLLKIILLMVTPLVLMIFTGPLGKLLNRSDGVSEHEESFVESFFEMFDTILRYLSNSISFVRLGAFALTHIALMSAIFILSEMLQSHAGQILTIIAGNIFVIVFEGLIVSIQVLRLEYYEFFTKFFRGKGHLFQPFNLYQLD